TNSRGFRRVRSRSVLQSLPDRQTLHVGIAHPASRTQEHGESARVPAMWVVWPGRAVTDRGGDGRDYHDRVDGWRAAGRVGGRAASGCGGGPGGRVGHSSYFRRILGLMALKLSRPPMSSSYSSASGRSTTPSRWAFGLSTLVPSANATSSSTVWLSTTVPSC